MATKRPPVEATTTKLKQLLHQDTLQQSPAQAAELYRAAVALLGELKQDLALLQRVRCVVFSYSNGLEYGNWKYDVFARRRVRRKS